MDNPFDFFDAIYCINLDERTDRWEHSVKQFEKLGILDKVQRFSAIKPVHDERWNRHTKWNNRWKYPLIGAVGCAESHKAVITLAKKRGLKNVMVFEDDFNICDNWKHNLECALGDIEKKSWSIFYLGYHLHKADNLIRKSGDCLNKMRSHRKRGIHRTLSLAYNASCFDYLIKNIDSFRHRKFGRQGHVDKFYSRNRRLKKYFASPAILEPNHEFESNIS